MTTAPDDAAPHDETCARCDRRICVCMYDKAPVEEVATVWGPLCSGCGSMTQPHRHGAGWITPRPVPAAVRQVDPDAPGWASARDTVATGDRVGGEERFRTACRLDAEMRQLCAQHGRLWPCYDGRPAVADAVMADLGAAVTEFGELREAVATTARAFIVSEVGADMGPGMTEQADRLAVAVLALDEMRALLDSAAKVQRVEALVDKHDQGRFRLGIPIHEIRDAVGGEGS